MNCERLQRGGFLESEDFRGFCRLFILNPATARKTRIAGPICAWWLVAQADSEILPDGDREKQLMQSLLNQRDNLEEAAKDKKLF